MNGSRIEKNLLSALLVLILSALLGGGVKIYYYYDPLNDSFTFTNQCSDRRDCKPLFEEKGTVAHKKGYRLLPGDEGKYDAFIRKAADKYALDFDLIKSVIKAESQFDRDAHSSKGARGLMQLMPDTAKLLGVADAFDPEQNIMGGSRYLRDMLKKFKDTEKALAAYNAGPAAVVYYEGIPPYKETQCYVTKIKRFYNEYTGKNP
jgi:hypothetical protein